MDNIAKQLLESKKVNVHSELIEILEELRNDIKAISYGAWNENLSYTDLTHLLARKIKAAGGIKKLRGTI